MVAVLSMFAIQIARSRDLTKEKAIEYISALEEIPDLIEHYLEDWFPIMEAVEAVKDAKSVYS